MSQFSCLYMVDYYKTTLDKIHLSKCMSLWSLLPHWICDSIMNCLVQQTIMQVCDIIQDLGLGIKRLCSFHFYLLEIRSSCYEDASSSLLKDERSCGEDMWYPRWWSIGRHKIQAILVTPASVEPSRWWQGHECSQVVSEELSRLPIWESLELTNCCFKS